MNPDMSTIASKGVSQKIKTEWQTVQIMIRRLIIVSSGSALFAKVYMLVFWAEKLTIRTLYSIAMSRFWNKHILFSTSWRVVFSFHFVGCFVIKFSCLTKLCDHLLWERTCRSLGS